MGAWGEKSFQNDSALDWLAELEAEGYMTVHVVRELADDGDIIERR